jgi:DNA mismatch repair protein MutL
MAIQVLDSLVAAQIAAGEVVERPASVVKELVENALDAGATRISVGVRGGGIDELVIQDNGSGIPADEVELAFARHATSKLTTADDLWAIRTLGFRGEALPSIAAIAQITCMTRTRAAPAGVELRIAGGVVQDRTAKGGMPGTTFTIRNLFYNVPVRRSFLKSPGAEAAAITAVVTQYALAYPQVRFTLTRDGREVFHTNGSDHLPGAVLAIYGLDIARALLPVEWAGGEDLEAVSVRGLVSPPTLHRSSREAMHLTVNGRSVAPRGQLAGIIEDAYHTLLMKGRFPIVVLRLDVHPAAVDVNVHPTKSEVKFRDPQQVAHALGQAIRPVVQGTSVVQGWDTGAADDAAPPDPEPADVRQAGFAEDLPVDPPVASAPPPAPARQERPDPPPARRPDTPFAADDTAGQPSTHQVREARPLPPTPPARPADRVEASARPAALAETGEYAPPPDAAPTPPAAPPPPASEAPPVVERTVAARPPVPPAPEPAAAQPPPAPARPREEASDSGALPSLRALAQLAQTYVLAEGPEGALYLIDQHAAHERITYERLLTQHAAGAVQSQTLLLPQAVALAPAAREALLGAADELASWGFAIAEDADGVLVHALPAAVAPEDLATTLRDLADQLQAGGPDTLATRRDHTLATLACHTSVRAGQTLNPVEQQSLIEGLARCQGPRTCPHGRPTVIVVTLQQLARQFGRLGALNSAT